MSHKIKVENQGNVPFSWENKPGVCKVTRKDCPAVLGHLALKLPLPPPPCRPESTTRAYFHDMQVPLPPSGFQPPSRTSFKKGLGKQDDPFLTAYRECMKSTRKGKLVGGNKGDVGFGLRKNMSILSCKHSCSVRDDSIVRISRLPDSKSQRERDEV